MRPNYLFDLSEVMSDAFIDGVTDTQTVLATDERFKGLVEHGGGADDDESQRVVRVVEHKPRLHMLVVPAHLCGNMYIIINAGVQIINGSMPVRRAQLGISQLGVPI
jgi:hypothetical protein